MGKAEVQEFLRKRLAALTEKANAQSERVIEELARLAFADLRKAAEWGPDGLSLKSSEELDDETAAAVLEVSETTSETGGSLRIKLHPKVKALELLGRYHKLFVDQVEHGGEVRFRFVDPGEAKSAEKWAEESEE